VHLAFAKIDKDSNGSLDVQDIIGLYDASKHPDVISKKRTATEVLREFLETFDVGGEVDGIVTLSEWENYYANISASIDDDDYFELMIRNAWHISGGEGWCANTANRRVLVTNADGSQSVVEIKDDLGLKADDKQGMVSRLRAQGVNAASVELYGAGEDDNNTSKFGNRSNLSKTSPAVIQSTSASVYKDPTNSGLSNATVGSLGRPNSAAYQKLALNVNSALNSPINAINGNTSSARPRSASGNRSNTRVGGSAALKSKPDVSMHPVIDSIKEILAKRGSRGIAGLGRAFKRFDKNGNKQLSFDEFSQALTECGIPIPEPSKRQVFTFFDKDRSQSLSYDEFLVGIRVRCILLCTDVCS
jgi:Ca2+-binding EF-hand superfamily protein